jgi:hypothetical protein
MKEMALGRDPEARKDAAMMNGEFVQEFKRALASPTLLTAADGKPRLLAPQDWKDVTPKPFQVSPLVINTLTGLVDYIKSNSENLPLDGCMAHVVTPGLVEVCARIEGEAQEFRRKVYSMATTDMHGKGFPFGQYLDAESFVIGLQTLFLPSPQRDEILMLLASIKESVVRETVDNGVSQEVKTAGGVVMVGMTKVPNPVELQPYRTFREVPQPVSRFILRLRSGKDGEKPACALFEADGGSWKLEAILGISDYLRSTVGSLIHVIG